MYHGIIQEAQWSGPGTYLRARIQQYDLDKVVHKGRVWRLVYDGVKFDRSDALAPDRTMPRMNDETPAQLVTHLGHPNGWWRDTAQQLLVLKQDKSVVPALQNMLKTSTSLVERFHVLWTLEGLGALDAATVRTQMTDAAPRMRIQAIRASETLYKAGDKSFAADYKRLAEDPSSDVVVQAMLTMNKWKVADATPTIKSLAATNKARGVQLVATAILNPAAPNGGRGGPGRGGGPVYTPEQQGVIEKGGQIYKELCFACHGDDGLGATRPGDTSGVTMAPRLAGSPRVNGHRDYVIKAVLHGLTGPVDDRTYTDQMIAMNTNPDDWVASVASYVRTNFGNAAGMVTPADVARVRAATLRKTPWTIPELEATLPKALLPDATWKVTASHNPDGARGALGMTAWSSQAPQAPGMWFQVELPQAMTISEIQFDSTSAGGRGGGGRNAIAAPGAAAPGARGAAPGAPAAMPATPGYPRGYRVETSMNGTAWTPAADGKGESSTTLIAFKPVQAKFVRITQTGAADGAPAWSIQQLRLFAPGKASGG
jgi:mono/diheme cytochrome c family protein